VVRSPERNILSLNENRSCIIVCCLSVGLALLILIFVWPFIAQDHTKVQCDLGPDRWSRGSSVHAY
jgi:hypothetical protein